MKRTKILALTLACVFTLSALAGCSSKNDPVVLTLGDNDIKASQYTYALSTAYLQLKNDYNQKNPNTDQEGNAVEVPAFDYDANFENAKISAIEYLKQHYAYRKMLSDANIVSTKEDEDYITEYIKYNKESLGTQSFKESLRTMGITEERFKQELLVEYTFSMSVGKIFRDDLYPLYEKDFISAKHILISFHNAEDGHDHGDDEITEEDVLAKASEVYEKAKAGEDFDKLITEYSEDEGQPKSGYAFKEGQMVDEFYNAAKALKISEVSEPVKTEYGYHIILRTEKNEENFNDNAEYITDDIINAKIDAAIADTMDSFEIVYKDEFNKITAENYSDYFII